MLGVACWAGTLGQRPGDLSQSHWHGAVVLREMMCKRDELKHPMPVTCVSHE